MKRFPWSTIAALLLPMFLVGVACVLDELRYEGRACSSSSACGGGTVCDVAQGKCVRAGRDGWVEASLFDSTPSEQRDLPPPSDSLVDRPTLDKRPADGVRHDVKLGDKTLSADKSLCTPACGQDKVCCKNSTGAMACVANDYKDCVCDPASGEPCASPSPACCITSGTIPTCHATTEGCQCSPTTQKPCFGAFAACCKKGADTVEHCYAACP